MRADAHSLQRIINSSMNANAVVRATDTVSKPPFYSINCKLDYSTVPNRDLGPGLLE